MENHLESLQYPIGKFICPTSISSEQICSWIKVIEDFPSKVKNATIHLSDGELQKTYREGGWTIAQVVNHYADSHLNSFILF